MQQRVTYTVSEVAARFGVHHATVHAWIKLGILKSIKVKGRRLIPAEAERALIENSAA